MSTKLLKLMLMIMEFFLNETILQNTSRCICIYIEVYLHLHLDVFYGMPKWVKIRNKMRNFIGYDITILSLV